MDRTIKYVSDYPILSEWDYSLNLLDPYKLKYGSNKLTHWICPLGHKYSTKTKYRTINNTGCPYCNSKKVNRENCLATQFPHLLQEWSNKNSILPTEIHSKSGKLVWWQCHKDQSHVWKTSIKHRTINNSNCPYCCNSKINYNNSFGNNNSNLLNEWCFNLNTTDPYTIAPKSSYKFWWKCKVNSKHVWQASLNDRANGSGCPYCIKRISKLEQEYFNSLNINLLYQYNISKYNVDAFHKESNTILEFYGSFYHGDPEFKSKSQINPKTKLSYIDLYNKTKKREGVLLNLNYNLITIWELDYLKFKKDNYLMFKLDSLIKQNLIKNTYSNGNFLNISLDMS